MVSITYPQFHLLFVFPPLVALGVLAIYRDGAWWGRRPLSGAALELGVWTVSTRHTTGVTFLGLPIEEALFFLLTNLFVVQCLLMCVWLLDRAGRGEQDRWRVAVSRHTPDLEVDG